MRIRSLSFRGVGPYRDEQRIDFDQLGESGLYLINGPTGAGKSTIIDCICYGLYGRLASDEADLSRMRSDFAGPKDTTEVDLVFETAAGVFRVIRSPEYMRAKAKGEGVTPSRTTCRLFRIHPDGTEESIATNVASADSEMFRVIGLTRAQFVQTVVLPQGQFATFLYSDTRQRSEILKRIFNTQLYERVAEILKEDAKNAAIQKAAATDEMRTAIGQLATSIGLDDATRDPLLEFATNRLDEQLKAGLDELAPMFEQALTTASTAFDNAQIRVTAADIARDLARREADAQSTVATARQTVTDATAGVEKAQVALAPTTDLAATIAIEIDDSTVVATWRQRASAASSHAGELTAVLPDEETVIAWPMKEAAAVQAIEDLTASHEADRNRLSEMPAAITQQQAIANDRPTLEESTQLNALKGDLDAVQAQLKLLDDQQAQLPDLQERTKGDHDIAERIDADLASAGHAYRTGIAAELALQLEPGQPCAVCGATDHPAPARHAGNAVLFDDVENLRQRASDAHIALAESAAALRTAQDRVAEITAEITMSRDDLNAAQTELKQRQSDLKRRSEAADGAATAIAELYAERDRLTERANKYAQDLASKKAALDTTRAAMKLSAEKVAAAHGDYPSVQERLNDVRALETALSGLADQLATLDTARASQALAELALAAMTRHDGFGDVDAAQAAWTAADVERLTADRTRGEAAARLEHLRTGTATIDTLCQERADLIARNADLIDLAELFSAGRGSEIGLHIYILKSLFDSVMEAANRRFESLLNGRYRLVPAPESDGDGRKLQGLGVSVEDRLTGRVRPATSLSGGETFCASLALALGLSDVVRMTAGGIGIGSLFIDEGFGSLDGNQLDEVMLMLGHLSSDGRRVGVISHVDSMKSAITERIDVTAVAEDRPTSLRVSWMA
ncbi:MAG: SMC family ATPase [Actinomycetota bacterium]|nr:SMC family ATPase [Actinomycetota bacterium]